MTIPTRFRNPVPLKGPRIIARARPRHKTGRMNKTEQAWAAELEAQKLAGLVLWWEFEAITLLLADDTRYTPDFAVVVQDGTLEFHECKAWWKSRNGPAWEDDAKVKIKVAARYFPMVFKGVSPKPTGEWHVEFF